MKERQFRQCTAVLDHGITLIDTAQAYRTSEAILGKALKGGRRAQVFLATKVSREYSPEAIRRAMENSLRDLQTDHVDLYQIHGWNPQYPVDESMETMEKLRQEGKTRSTSASPISTLSRCNSLPKPRLFIHFSRVTTCLIVRLKQKYCLTVKRMASASSRTVR